MLTKTLYHGSDKKVTTLEPLGVDMGMIFQQPKWAVFFWEDRELANDWAIFQYIRRNKLAKTYYHVPTGKAILRLADLKAINREIPFDVYVYKKNVKLGEYRYGSSPDIREYTITSRVIPDETYVLKVTKEILSGAVVIMTDAEISNYLKRLQSGAFVDRRGLLFSLLMDPKRDQVRHKYNELIKKGELNYGDDLSGVSVESFPPSSEW